MKCFGYEKTKRKKLLCKIFLLDDTSILHEAQEASRGQDLMDVVCKHLNLLETAYFGLRFVDAAGQPHWLSLNRRAVKQLQDLHPLNLYFGVKFYAVDPCKLAEEITRYQFFLQLKQDILQSRLPLPLEMAAELFAYVVQSELGDFDPMQHTPGYISEFQFMANQSQDLEARVSELHKHLLGQVPAAAELAFLERVKWLDLYGADLHPVLGEDCMEYFIALVPSGILVLRGKSKVGQYYWPRVVKFYRKGRFFMLKVAEKSEEEKTYGFELPGEAASKHLEHCCRDHQTFYSLASGKESPGREVHSRIIGLSQRFRNSLNSRRGTIVGQTGPDLRSSAHSHSRSPPTVVRIPSRRYQRRAGQEAAHLPHALSIKQDICKDFSQVITDDVSSAGRHAHTRSSVMGMDSKSGVWDKRDQGGLFSSENMPSPYSVYTEGRSRHRSGSKSRAGYSDNESQGSRGSRRSRHSHHSSSSRRSRCRNHDENQSEAASTHSRRRHRRRHRCSRGESTEQLVDSQDQWREIQRIRQSNLCSDQMVNVALRDSSENRNHETHIPVPPESRASKHGPKSSTNLRTKRSQFIPPEVRKFIESSQSDPASDLQFTQVTTESRRSSEKAKIRSGRDVVPRNSDPGQEESARIEPVYCNLPSSKRAERVAPNLRSAGSRAPVCADDLDLALEPQLKENEMATEL